MFKTITLAAALVLITTAAASAFEGTSICTQIGGSTMCTARGDTGATSRGSDARTRLERIADDKAEEAQYQSWLRWCKPVLYVDKDSVKRYRYEHKGCDLGETEDAHQ